MKKVIVSIVAIVLLCGCVAGGTYAWLMDQTAPVVNTFTVGDINITLTEDIDKSTLKMIPGQELAKDPKVTVKANSEACWLFVKIEATENIEEYLTYSVATGWTALDGETGVYYRDVASATAADQEFPVLEGNKVTVNQGLTRSDLQAVTNGTKSVQLSFTAYAVQKAGFDSAAEAWEVVSPTPAETTTSTEQP